MTDFSKRHYEAIAQLLSETHAEVDSLYITDDCRTGAEIVLGIVEDNLMNLFKSDNARFDARRFIDAIKTDTCRCDDCKRRRNEMAISSIREHLASSKCNNTPNTLGGAGRCPAGTYANTANIRRQVLV